MNVYIPIENKTKLPPEKPLFFDDEALLNLGITGRRRLIAVALQSRNHDIIMIVVKGIYAVFLGSVSIC